MPFRLCRGNQYFAFHSTSDRMNRLRVGVLIYDQLVSSRLQLREMPMVRHIRHFDDPFIQFKDLPVTRYRTIEIVERHAPAVMFGADDARLA